MNATLFENPARAKFTPREYQTKDHDECFRLWDSGVVGTLTRVFTGGGKTFISCLKADTWLRRGDNHRVMIISYETQLVDQWREEVEQYMGITPGIEMDSQAVDPANIPKVVVACRASLLRHPAPEPDQLNQLARYGINHLGGVHARRAKQYLTYLARGVDPEEIKNDIIDFNKRPEVSGKWYSRVHKFDWRLNWLLFFDEAHRHVHKLKSVGHIIDWFDQNPASRRNGPTATPKRSDLVSIGERMFSGIAIDYPLFAANKPCAVRDGWAVPYVQKYIEVEGVDFSTVNKIAGDYDESELERILGTEKQLAKLVEPMIEIAGDRQTLIFSPGVDMAKNVARYINARQKATCPGCQKTSWHPIRLVGDGAACKCGRLVAQSDLIPRDRDPAMEVDGSTPFADRQTVYSNHQAKHFQFLSVCNLCREGYNDPNISCVAVFRPVSKKASSLAEQMKGRGCRPLKEITSELGQLKTAEERVAMIAASAKPYCLIIDLVGVSGLADCASTARIYADGLPDEIQKRAEDILLEDDGGYAGEVITVEDAIEQAKREDQEAKEAARLERLEAERRAKREAEERAKAGASVRYSTHDIGHGSQTDPSMASSGLYAVMKMLGMDVKKELSKRQAFRIIGMLKVRTPYDRVASMNHLSPDDWAESKPSLKQMAFINRMRGDTSWVKTTRDASMLIGAAKNAQEFEQRIVKDILYCKSDAELTALSTDIANVYRLVNVDAAVKGRIRAAGQQRRGELRHTADDSIPE